jgi:hypothetical protein
VLLCTVAVFFVAYPNKSSFVTSNAGNVPTKYRGNKALGRWVSTQRAYYKRFESGEVTDPEEMEEGQRRIRLLNELCFTWSMLPTDNSYVEEGEAASSSSDDDLEDHADGY